MGEVWRADHLTLGTSVAVKLIDTTNRDDAAEMLARFRQEAWAAAQLKSPHVVQILDHGADGRVAFMAMELLEGESLEQRLSRRGRLTPSEVAHVLREMARGIERAHAAGIIHRDLKPPNVFIARVDGTEVLKVLDFGIAKTMGPSRDVHLQTQNGFVVGTPAYMSPEQVLGKPIDHRSDLWQMAILTFECITGKRPFDGETLGQLFMAVCTLPLPVPSSHAPVPDGFDAWFARAASRDPSGRFTSAREMAEALGAILAPGGVGESAVPTVAVTGNRPQQAPAPTGRIQAWSTGRVEPPRRATPVALVAGLLLAPFSVMVVGGAVWLAKRPHVDPVTLSAPVEPPPPPPPVTVVAETASTAPLLPSPVAAPVPTATASAAVKPVPPVPAGRSVGRPRLPKPNIDLGI
jgi:serine/threonine-protein kinase